jgi:hypothetical protein
MSCQVFAVLQEEKAALKTHNCSTKAKAREIKLTRQ